MEKVIKKCQFCAMNRLELLLQLLEEQPTDAFTLFALAKEYEKTNDLANALHYYLKLREINPNYVGLYYHLGKLQELLDKPEAAIATYKEGMIVAKAAKDMHAYGELNGARMIIDDED